MFELIYNLPEELKEAARVAEAQSLPRLRRPANVVIGGMGGSGIGGEILQALLAPHDTLPVVTVKDYDLPKAAGRETLFFAVSFSGNTEETLSCYEQARARHATIVVVTGGGRLGELAAKNRDILLKITPPADCPPRTGIAYLFAPLLVTLARFRVIPDSRPDLKEAIRVLMQHRNRFRIKARALARELRDYVPVVYSTSRLLDPVANRWRCQFNENAKVFAHVNYFPELDHNEIVGMGGPRAFARLAYVLVLSDPAAHPRNTLRYELTLEILRKEYAEARVLMTEGRSDLARAFSLIMLGDLTSFYLAGERKVDPMPVRRIDELKRRLAAAK